MSILVPPPSPTKLPKRICLSIYLKWTVASKFNKLCHSLPLIIDLRKHRLGIFPIKTSLTKTFFLRNIKKARTMVPKRSIQDPYAILEPGHLAITDSEPPQYHDFFFNIHESRPEMRVS